MLRPDAQVENVETDRRPGGGAGEWRFRRLLLSYGVMVNTPPFGGGTPGSNPGSSTGF